MLPATHLSFWGDYCISLAQIPEESGRWFYSVTGILGRAQPADETDEPDRAGPFESDTAAFEAARIHLVRDKRAN
jgi:hypothetical protein